VPLARLPRLLALLLLARALPRRVARAGGRRAPARAGEQRRWVGPAARREPAEARDAREQASGAERAHHLAHLAEGLDELAHLARAPAAAAGDARGATLVDDLGAGALGRRHRADQRLDAPELALVDLLGERADPRQPREDLAQRPHALDHAQLLQQIL